MKRNVLWNILYSLILIFVLLGIGLSFAALMRLNMLPVLYLAGLGVLFAVLVGLIGWLLFGRGKKQGRGRVICGCVLALFVVCGCAVMTTVAMDVQEALTASSQEPEEVATREIYVMSRNPIREVSETVGYTYGYVKGFDEDCSHQVLDAVRQQTGDQIHAIGYTNIMTMVSALLNNRIDAMVLSEAYLDLLDGIEGFEYFDQQARLLAQVEVIEPEGSEMLFLGTGVGELEYEELDQTEEIPEQTEPEVQNFSKLEPFIVYVSGSDSRSKNLPSKGRSDVNILAVVNPMTKQVLLLNTPRDYYIGNPATGGAKDKLTHCGVYGFNNTIKALNTLYGIKTDYYVRINFSGFRKVIDAIGGITVHSDVAFTVHNKTAKIKVGENTLNGEQALAFARTRKGLKGGDNDRGKNQMEVIRAVIEKATSGTTIITNYSDIVKSIDGMFKMTVPQELISEIMKMQLSDMARWNVVSYAVTGSGDMAVCASATGMELSVIRPHQSSIKKAKRLIEMVVSSEILTEEVVEGIT